ncbi:hypothetical protein Anapl_00121 [Anas platyrhynchos]|uniref:Uncharacterized protein n=1 Tax=Anas platyrhynchos TaxID=8839 RepID=R0K285_ANAPL|nr:hypothetical protein Anapl_00121 [Anas platyrhynchos]
MQEFGYGGEDLTVPPKQSTSPYPSLKPTVQASPAESYGNQCHHGMKHCSQQPLQPASQLSAIAQGLRKHLQLICVARRSSDCHQRLSKAPCNDMYRPFRNLRQECNLLAKWKQHLHCDLWIRLSDHWSVWQENAGSDPLLQKMMTLVKVSLANQCPDSSILTNPTSTTFNESSEGSGITFPWTSNAGPDPPRAWYDTSLSASEPRRLDVLVTVQGAHEHGTEKTEGPCALRTELQNQSKYNGNENNQTHQRGASFAMEKQREEAPLILSGCNNGPQNFCQEKQKINVDRERGDTQESHWHLLEQNSWKSVPAMTQSAATNEDEDQNTPSLVFILRPPQSMQTLTEIHFL